MLPEAKSEDLLYISNVYTVTVYTYPGGKHVGTLKHFYRPEFECTDKNGDVFIGQESTLYEYAHGGTKPIGTLSTGGYVLGGCAVDPTTGDLAAAADTDSQGNIAVFKNASGSPSYYSDGKLLFYFCGYDDAGNLYADGTRDPSGIQFAELPKGSSKFVALTMNQAFEGPGAVQWDGRYLAIGDDAMNKIYRFSISGSSGTLQGTTTLGGAQSVQQWWIKGKKVIGSDDLPSTVWYWNYPTGGNPTKSITKAVFHPLGATISVARKRRALTSLLR
jgi:hypothetical protein